MTKKHTPSPKKEKTLSHRVLMIAGGLFLAFAILSAATVSSAWWLLHTYTTRMAPHVSIVGLDVSGKTYQETSDLIQEHIDALENTGVAVRYTQPDADNVDLAVMHEAVPLSASEDTQTLYTVDLKSTVDAAYSIGHEDNMLRRLGTLLESLLVPHNIAAAYTINEEGVTDLLTSTFATYETQPVDASIHIDQNSDIEIVPDASGITFDYPTIVDTIGKRIADLSPLVIDITPQETAASVRSSDLQAQRTVVETYLSHAPIVLDFEGHTWSFDAAEVGPWLTANAQGVSVDSEQLDAALDQVHSSIDTDAVDGRWALDKDAGGAPIGIHEIVPSEKGRAIDVAATAQAITNYLAGTSTDSTITVVTTESLPAFAVANHDALQIHDILGTGHSNMSGSPTNRRKNIARGVELLNGLLIPPGENFSLVQSIKPFELDNGYVPELVIKGNKTEPEIGGGLCQVGTTLFRGAMESGLPIVSRSNHSYAVPYYSDDRNHLPGTDATIYDPAPDMVFTNDTPGYILLQTRIDGNDLYFDFWGVSDGRDGSFSAPRAFDYVSPPPMKEIPTTTLAPGVRKCTESAHSGLTAEFTYTIKKSDGTQIDRVFTSKYKPWQAVCLVGQSTDTSATATQ